MTTRQEELLKGIKMNREITQLPYVIKIDGVMIRGYRKDFYANKSSASSSFSYLMKCVGFTTEDIKILKKSGRVTFEQIEALSEQEMIDKYIHEKLKNI